MISIISRQFAETILCVSALSRLRLRPLELLVLHHKILIQGGTSPSQVARWQHHPQGCLVGSCTTELACQEEVIWAQRRARV